MISDGHLGNFAIGAYLSSQLPLHGHCRFPFIPKLSVCRICSDTVPGSARYEANQLTDTRWKEIQILPRPCPPVPQTQIFLASQNFDQKKERKK